MQKADLETVFNEQAVRYDQQWTKLSPLRDALHFLLPFYLGGLPENARILCVGVGTGAELASLAEKFPAWRFTAVEPSGGMLEVCRKRAEAGGFARRCQFHEGYVDSLAPNETYSAATCFLVSQFILDPSARSAFFASIASRLAPGGNLLSSDLASEVDSAAYETRLEAWLKMMAFTGIPAEGLHKMRTAYARDVAVLPPAKVEAIIESGGFEPPVQIYQMGLIHAWFSRKAAETR